MSEVFVNGRAGIPPGDLKETYTDHFGPVSYAQLIYNALPISGGDKLTAAQCGLVSIVSVEVCGSGVDGTHTYTVRAFPLPNQNTKAGKDVANFILQWYILDTPGEVGAAVNLSAISVRLKVTGY